MEYVLMFAILLQYFQGNIAAASAVYRKALERAAEKQNLDALSTLYLRFARLDYMVDNIRSPQWLLLVFSHLVEIASSNIRSSDSAFVWRYNIHFDRPILGSAVATGIQNPHGLIHDHATLNIQDFCSGTSNLKTRNSSFIWSSTFIFQDLDDF